MRAFWDWLTADALPFWSEAGFDRLAERFVERLDFDGRPLDVPHRSMVQARQIFVYAHAAHLGWYPQGGPLAEAAMRALRRDFEAGDDRTASFAFAIGTDGRITSEIRDAYGHAFILFAIAWLHRLTGDPTLLRLADRVLAFADAHLLDAEHGGWFDQHPVGEVGKRQNPHMHLLEALLALDESAPGRAYIERAGTLVDLFRRRFFAEAHGALLEHFARDWSGHAHPARRDVFEPGHHFEWVWLLRQYERRSGDDLGSFRDRLYDTAVRSGLVNGHLVDEIRAGGDVLKSSHRLWPHTEAIKAAVVRHEDGDTEAKAFAVAMLKTLEGTFLRRPFAGGWIDHVDAAGTPLVAYVPASSLYHLTLAATELSRSFDTDA